MDNESNLWEDFLTVTEGIFVISGTILTIASMLGNLNSDLDKLE